MQLPDLKKKSKKTTPKKDMENNLEDLKKIIEDISLGSVWIVAYREKGLIKKVLRFMYYQERELTEEALRGRILKREAKPEGKFEILKVPLDITPEIIEKYRDRENIERGITESYKLVKEYLKQPLSKKDLQVLEGKIPVIEEDNILRVPGFITSTFESLEKTGKENIKEGIKNIEDDTYRLYQNNRGRFIDFIIDNTLTIEEQAEQVLNLLDSEGQKVFLAITKYLQRGGKYHPGAEIVDLPITEIMKEMSEGKEARDFTIKEKQRFTKKLRTINNLPVIQRVWGNKELNFRIINFKTNTLATTREIDQETGEYKARTDIYKKISFTFMEGVKPEDFYKTIFTLQPGKIIKLSEKNRIAYILTRRIYDKARVKSQNGKTGEIRILEAELINISGLNIQNKKNNRRTIKKNIDILKNDGLIKDYIREGEEYKITINQDIQEEYKKKQEDWDKKPKPIKRKFKG
jgi:hypothetical protein